MKYKFILALLFPAFALAQKKNYTWQYEQVKLDVEVGIAFGNEETHGGLIAAIEPKYSISDHLVAGVRLEHAYTGPFDECHVCFIDLSYIRSVAITGDYLFTKNELRPLVGLGVGYFKTSRYYFGTEENYYKRFGVTPRIGMEFDHFRTSIEMNFIGRNKEFLMNYVSLKFGGYISFGKKNKHKDS